MRRLLIITPARLDLDVEAHLALLMQTPALRVRLTRIGEDSAIMLARAVAATMSDRRAQMLLTVGRVAMQASKWFQGRHLHLVGPGASRHELERVRLLDPASVVAANELVAAGLPGSHVIAPPCPTRSASATRVRKLLGVRDDQKLVFVPSVPARTSGHRMAIWVVGILRFLNDRWRIATLSRNAGVFHDFAAQTSQPRLLVSHPSLDAMSIAAASDLALLAPDGCFDLMPLAACAASGVPIVAPDRPMLRDLAPSAGLRLVHDPKPRRLALTLLDDPDPIAPDPDWIARFTSPRAERAWLDLIDPRLHARLKETALSETA